MEALYAEKIQWLLMCSYYFTVEVFFSESLQFINHIVAEITSRILVSMYKCS